jgi:hypothetical protein
MENIPQSIAKKLFAAQGKLNWVEKGGVNSAQNYRYTRAEDLISAVKKACQEVGLIIIVSNLNPKSELVQKPDGKYSSYSRLEAQVTLIDGENGEMWQVPGIFAGEGVDSGDKSPYKAQTGAKKYALMGLFGIAMGDDPEEDGEPEESPRQAHQQNGTVTVESKSVKPQQFETMKQLMMYLTSNKRAGDIAKVNDMIREKKGLPEIVKALGL